MIRARRIEVGAEPVDLTEGSGGSGVSIQMLANQAPTMYLYVGHDPEQADPIPVGIGASGPINLPQLALGSTDRLYLWRDEGKSGPVDVVLGWS